MVDVYGMGHYEWPVHPLMLYTHHGGRGGASRRHSHMVDVYGMGHYEWPIYSLILCTHREGSYMMDVYGMGNYEWPSMSLCFLLICTLIARR